MDIHPPKLCLRFFRWFCHPDLRDYIEGDLNELYRERLSNIGKIRTDTMFMLDVMLLFRPGIIRPPENIQLNTYAMCKNYFKIGWRNLLRNKGYSIINIGGLALAMAIAMLIGLWVWDELSFNRYYKNYDHIAQIMKAGYFEGKHYRGQKYLPYPLIEELQSGYGENFRHVVPINSPGGSEGVLSFGEKNLTRTGMSIGEGGPEMLSLDMICGDWSGLKDPYSIILSESTSRVFFGDEDPRGKTMKVNNTTDVVVTGVYRDFPKNTAFYGITYFEPWSLFLINNPWVKRQGWENHFLWAYAELQPNISFAEAGARIRDAEMKVIRNLAYMKDELKFKYEVQLLPMKDWHLYSDFKKGEIQNGPVEFVWFIGAMGVFVLMLACINFMNLNTARSEKRAREVGLRKTIGSYRYQLIGQFFSESFLYIIFAFSVAILLVYISLPWFNDLAGKKMSIPWSMPEFWICAVAFIMITGLLSGSYPAFYLSSFKPVSILKGSFHASRYASIPRKVLVILQFTVSVMLIACTGEIYHQLIYVKNRPVGYDLSGLIEIRKKSGEINEKMEVLRTSLMNTGVVSGISESGGSVTTSWSGNGGFNWEGKDPNFEPSLQTLNVSSEFGKTVGWQFVAGRDFSPEIASDSDAFILNEAAVKYLGVKDPVGKMIRWTNRPWGVDKEFRVVGVIRDMVMDSPFMPIRPTVYFTFGYRGVMQIRISKGANTSDALTRIGRAFNAVIPGIPFDYRFVDQEYAQKFSTEDRIGKLAGVFATLAIIISCLGLFGLAAYVAEQRTKEIGIRKVLGATVTNIWGMLSWQFILLVIISSVIATPIAWYILHKGLQDYEYRTEISWWIFAMTGIGAVAITLITVSFQSVKAAVMNPVKSLRSE